LHLLEFESGFTSPQVLENNQLNWAMSCCRVQEQATKYSMLGDSKGTEMIKDKSGDTMELAMSSAASKAAAAIAERFDAT
jgi:hypothetical protein